MDRTAQGRSRTLDAVQPGKAAAAMYATKVDTASVLSNAFKMRRS
ncbi:hypothetical protein XCR_3322 [Xanthomonas campestris pv. raphani 756C]|nr:hypothetical protein XCR_3322 [Xanthomonas campestris pv. raphani 756C]